MSDELQANTDASENRNVSITARLLATRWVLLAASLAIILLWLTERLATPEAFFVFLVVIIVAMLASRRKLVAQQRVEQEKESIASFETAFGRLANALTMPCIIIDGRAIVQHVSEQAKVPFPKLEAGMPISFSLRHPDLLAAIEECQRTGEDESVEFKLNVPNETWYHVSVSPLSTKGLGGVSRSDNWLVMTMLDTTERRRIDQMRADFIANASHELRTPLTSLVGFIETLQGPAASDAQAREKFLGIMASQADRMSHLINDLLSLSRIELHQHVAPKTPVNLTALLNEVVEGIQPLAHKADVVIRIALSDDATTVLGDRNELYEVFENLIDNAIKYGGTGEFVDVNLDLPTESKNAFTVKITDYGRGIASEHVPRLTERFYRVDAESSRQKKGTGLGLAIVKHIVNRHKGLMVVKSELGIGTSIEISLPAET